MRNDAALGIFQRVGQATGLRAFAAIGTAAGMGVADITLPAEGHAERPVDEKLQRDMSVGGNLPNFVQCQFACQDDL